MFPRIPFSVWFWITVGHKRKMHPIREAEMKEQWLYFYAHKLRVWSQAQ